MSNTLPSWLDSKWTILQQLKACVKKIEEYIGIVDSLNINEIKELYIQLQTFETRLENAESLSATNETDIATLDYEMAQVQNEIERINSLLPNGTYKLSPILYDEVDTGKKWIDNKKVFMRAGGQVFNGGIELSGDVNLGAFQITNINEVADIKCDYLYYFIDNDTQSIVYQKGFSCIGNKAINVYTQSNANEVLFYANKIGAPIGIGTNNTAKITSFYYVIEYTKVNE